MAEAPEDARVDVVFISHSGRAWATVLHHLRTFRGGILMFAFSDSATYDAGTAPIYRAPEVALFKDGGMLPRSPAEPSITSPTPPSSFASASSPSPFSAWFRETFGDDLIEEPWVFKLPMDGKPMFVAVVNGMHDYEERKRPPSTALRHVMLVG